MFAERLELLNRSPHRRLRARRKSRPYGAPPPAPQPHTNGARSLDFPERFSRALGTLAGMPITLPKGDGRLRWPTSRTGCTFREDLPRRHRTTCSRRHFRRRHVRLPNAELQETRSGPDADPYGGNFSRPARSCRSRPRPWIAAIDLFSAEPPAAERIGSAQRPLQTIVGASPRPLRGGLGDRKGGSPVATTLTSARKVKRSRSEAQPCSSIHYYTETRNECPPIREDRSLPLANGPEVLVTASYYRPPRGTSLRHCPLFPSRPGSKEAEVTGEPVEHGRGSPRSCGDRRWLLPSPLPRTSPAAGRWRGFLVSPPNRLRRVLSLYKFTPLPSALSLQKTPLLLEGPLLGITELCPPPSSPSSVPATG